MATKYAVILVRGGKPHSAFEVERSRASARRLLDRVKMGHIRQGDDAFAIVPTEEARGLMLRSYWAR